MSKPLWKASSIILKDANTLKGNKNMLGGRLCIGTLNSWPRE